MYIYIYTKRVLWPLFHAEFIYVRFKETRRTLLCSGTRKFSDIHERVKKKKDRRQILRPSRVSRECLNVVYFTCVHMYFVRSMSSRIIGRKVWSNPLGEDFWGWFSPVDDNSLRVEIFGYRSNGIMQTENIFYIFFSLIERTKNIYIYCISLLYWNLWTALKLFQILSIIRIEKYSPFKLNLWKRNDAKKIFLNSNWISIK